MATRPFTCNLRWMLLAGVCFAGPIAGTVTAHELSPVAPSRWDRSAAAHLLRRAGFGGTAAEIDKLHALGLEAAVESLVNYSAIPYECPPPPIDGELKESPDRRLLRTLDEDERRRAIQQRNRAERRAMVETRLWWIERMVNSPRPFEEKMTLFWHGRLTSGFREVDRAWFLYEQNEFLRRSATSNLRELLLGISKDRAMLIYLNNNRNVATNPNENYARELLELFSLGLGNYSEGDIRAAARAFTGWTFDDEGFVFRNAAHDQGNKHFLGRSGRLDGGDVIDIIVEQPACSRHLARALLKFFVTPEPDKRLVERFAATLRQNDLNIRASMRALFLSEAFYASEHRGALVRSPVELVVGAARQMESPIVDLPAAARAMSEMGQELFQPPNVKGWDGGTKWINTATIYHRYNGLRGLIYGAGGRNERPRAMTDEDVGAAMGGDAANRNAVSRLMFRDQPPCDPLPALRARKLHSAEAVVDHYLTTLLAVPLPSEKRDVLVRYLDAGDDARFSIDARGAGDRLRTLLFLICSTPEYQMN